MTFKKPVAGSLAAACLLFLAACDGDDGANGAPGGTGQNSLIKQSALSPGDEHCFNGGLRVDSGTDANRDEVLQADEVAETSYLCDSTVVSQARHFNRIASFPVCRQLDADCDVDTTTAAEIVAASEDGQTLIYTDSPAGQVGFVDISNPEQPSGLGVLAMAGEPTSVAVLGDYALVGVNTSADFVSPSGNLAVVDIASRSIVATLALAGQPDSVAVSPDGGYAAVAIENERDEDLNDGAPPQLPGGSLDIIRLNGAPTTWTVTNVPLTGLAELYPGDPEPEYVDINSDNIAVLSLQENNHLVLIDLSDGSIVNHFGAGATDLQNIDATEEEPGLISQTESLEAVMREPDGVSWLSTGYFITANEGDLDGGSRGFTVFNTAGEVVHDSGAELEQLAARFGHYPEARSANKGNEPENVEYAVFGSERYAFVNSERASMVFVYDMADRTRPVFKQALPAALGPEGALAIPQRNLLVVASEEDSRENVFRSALNIYHYQNGAPMYPTIVSADRLGDGPIPWSALSGLTSDPDHSARLYAVEDSFYQQNRIFALDVSAQPGVLFREMRINDGDGVLAGMSAAALADASVDDDDATRVNVFDEADLALLTNEDDSVNLDPEGIAKAADGGFWLVSEGAGSVGDGDEPVNSLNLLIKTDAEAVIQQVITLPDSVNEMQLRFGFEGVAQAGDDVYVIFQRAWGGEATPRIGVYDTVNATWSFLYYPLDSVASLNGGWVGLSDLTSLGGGQFLVVERDNQGGPDAAIKRLYRIDVTGLVAGETVSKTLVRDLLPDLASRRGLIPEKIEGSAVLKNGDVYIVNDNDGVDDNSGETQLLNLGDIL